MEKIRDEQTHVGPILPSATSRPSLSFLQPVTLTMLLNPKVGSSLRRLELRPRPSGSDPAWSPGSGACTLDCSCLREDIILAPEPG